MSQQYSLRWNNHQPNFISMFTSLLNTQTLVDVTLAAEGKQLKAHKVVLSACSTYFQSLFVDNPSRHPIVILKDVTFADLRTMVDFMYCGEVNVTEEQLPKVLDTAKLLKIKGLTEMPESTSLTRSQGTSSDFQSCTSADFQSPRESLESQRHSVSPALSNSNRRKRRRMSSGGSGQLNLMPEENRGDEHAGQVEIMRGPNDTVTMRSVPQQRDLDTQHQTNDQQNLNVEPLAMDAANASVISQGQWSMMEHTYPRYSNACINNSGLQPEQMYMNNALNTHMSGGDMSDYGQSLGVVGPSPGGGGGGGGGGCVEPQSAPDQSQIHVPKRRRTSNPQSAENFQRALEAVRFGGIGFCKAARMFGVNNRTLWLEYKKKGYPTIRPSIKSRIKKEQTSPPRELKQEMNQPEQQMALICPPHPVPVNFIDSRSIEFPIQTVSHSSTINILGVNFNSMQ